MTFNFSSLLVLFQIFQNCQGTSAQSTSFTPYALLSSEEIHATLLEWKQLYSNLLDVFTAQDAFGLPAAGSTSNYNDCPFDVGEGCLNYVAVLYDKIAHPPDSPSNRRLPTVLLSGELHGNERVGPTAVMETARLLLEAATCEALPHYTTNATLHTLQLEQAQTCRSQLKDKYGMTDPQRQWLARLLSTRRILVIPTANALGYYRDSREEDTIDPNRDFPYDQLDARDCMQTIAARTLNELYRAYAVTNSFTYHGGTELLGYEWGNPSHFGYVSPDDVAQDQLARAYATYGGAFQGNNGRDHPTYLYGDMNSIIYYVRGGFEDYAYAGSWDTIHMMSPCQPTTFGGYDASKTIYDDGMLRSFNMLVETSWEKTPDDNDLGTTWNVLFQNNKLGTSDNKIAKDLKQQDKKNNNHRNLRGSVFFPWEMPKLSAEERLPNGHVSRNIRLSLASIDLVRPYLHVTQVDTLSLDDVVPLTPSAGYHHDATCSRRNFLSETTTLLLQQAIESRALPVVSVPVSNNDATTTLPLQWSVGGAMTIDETQLWVATLGGGSSTNTVMRTPALPDASAWLDEYICGNPLNTQAASTQRLDPASMRAYFQPLSTATQQSGTGYFSPSGSQPTPTTDDIMGPAFSAQLNLADLLQLDTATSTTATYLLVAVSAKVDSAWVQMPNDAPVGPTNTNTPQSHMVQSRFNNSWYYENPQGYIIQGQDEFFSTPVLVQLVYSNNTDGETAKMLNDRFQSPIYVSNSQQDSFISEPGVEVQSVVEQKEAVTDLVATNTVAPTLFDDNEKDVTQDLPTGAPTSAQTYVSSVVVEKKKEGGDGRQLEQSNDGETFNSENQAREQQTLLQKKLSYARRRATKLGGRPLLDRP